MSGETENLALELLRGLRAGVANVDAKLADAKVELKSEIHLLRAMWRRT